MTTTMDTAIQDLASGGHRGRRGTVKNTYSQILNGKEKREIRNCCWLEEINA